MALTAEVRKRFPSGASLDATISLAAVPGPVTVLFGPSGAGKTTFLRCIAGLERPDEGTIRFDGEPWFHAASGIDVPPQRRRIGIVFQEDALFPHLTVEGNVVFGLRASDAEAKARAAELLRFAGIAELARRLPAGLSGGERRRVALARALAPRPRLLLLDEPLSALDAPAREELRRDLRGLLVAAGIPTIFVTHDRTEALALGDTIAVLVGGRLHQIGSVPDVFGRPADAVVARVVGVETVLPARVLGTEDGLLHLDVDGLRLMAVDAGERTRDDVFACIRAEEVLLGREEEALTSARNRFASRVVSLTNEGPLVRVQLDAGFPLAALVTRSAAAELALASGEVVVALVKAQAVHVVPRACR